MFGAAFALLSGERSLGAQDRGDARYEQLVTLYRASPDEAVARVLQLTQAARVAAVDEVRYLVSYMPSAGESGWHAIDVTLKNQRGKVTARRGYRR